MYYHNVEEDYERRVEEPLDVDFEDANWMVRLGDCRVVAADHGVEDVVDHLEEGDFEEAGDVDGYTTVVGPDDRYGYAVDGSRILLAFVREDATDALENLVDVQNGDVDMYVDESDVFADAIDVVEGDVVSVDAVDLGGDIVGRSHGVTFEGETTTVQTADVYGDEEDYDEEAIREWASETEDLSASFHGRVVLTVEEWDTDEYGVSS